MIIFRYLNGETIYIDHCGLLKLGEFGVGYKLGQEKEAASDLYAAFPVSDTTLA